MTELIPYENESIARNFIFGFKSSLLMLQTFFVIIVIITREEYIYRAIDSDLSTDSNKYKTAELITIISSSVFFAFLLLEFFVILMGISTKFLKASSFQILLHFWGCILTLFVIINRMHYSLIVIITVIFGLVPFLIELLVLCYYYFQRKIQQNYIQRPGQRTHLSREEVSRRKKIEEKNIQRSRGHHMNNEIEEVKEQRQDDQRIEGQDNPFDDDHQPREEHKDDLHDYEDEDEKYEEDEYYKQDYPRDGPSLNPDRDYDDDYSRSPPRDYDYSRSPRNHSEGYSPNDRSGERSRSGGRSRSGDGSRSGDRNRPRRSDDLSRGMDLD
ncbi:unnamed protein product [Moneuplotes crassus]|uniref:Transmembrane protein n=1 Tax=Euplotes crassus TaxID=5936 RepID=A0AAD1XLM3_EUPCR|nr:unnamed protein product [Moneuplotes crassus]